MGTGIDIKIDYLTSIQLSTSYMYINTRYMKCSSSVKMDVSDDGTGIANEEEEAEAEEEEDEEDELGGSIDVGVDTTIGGGRGIPKR